MKININTELKDVFGETIKLIHPKLPYKEVEKEVDGVKTIEKEINLIPATFFNAVVYALIINTNKTSEIEDLETSVYCGKLAKKLVNASVDEVTEVTLDQKEINICINAVHLYYQNRELNTALNTLINE
jgi:hypothetical protein